MNVVDLELSGGGKVSITLPDPGDSPSFYVFTTVYCGNVGFWQLLSRIMAAAGRPVCAVHEAGLLGVKQTQITRASMARLLQQRGYGFGLFYDAWPGFTKAIGAESRKLLFLRDPRGVLMRAYHVQITIDRSAFAADRPVPLSFAEFLQTPTAEAVVARYRRYAAIWRTEPNVTLLRFEHIGRGWRALASDLIATLKLPIQPLAAAAIAGSVSPIAGGNPSPDFVPPPRIEVAEMEAWLEDVLDVFGYAPHTTAAERRSSPKRAAGAVVASARVAGRPGDLFEPDEALLFRLKPNACSRVQVLGREVAMEIDDTGCRKVEGQPRVGEKTLAAYGCSCTFGTAIPNEETFCSLLQAMFPAWRVENHGVGSYSTSRNLIQLERDAPQGKWDFVTFCWIPGHHVRNVAGIGFVNSMSGRTTSPPAGDRMDLRLPRAGLDENGLLEMRAVRMPRHDLRGIDYSDFEPDPWYADLVCFRLFERANKIVTGYGGHFFVTTLIGHFSAALDRRLAEARIPVVDASLSGREYTCLPDDAHPNGLANRFFAERIRDHLLQFCGRVPKVPADGVAERGN